MKIFYFLLILQFLALPLFSQESKMKHEKAHVLELVSTGADQPVSTNANLFDKDGKQWISIQFPDGEVTTDYVVLEDAQFKFQLSQIRNSKLVTIQFVGSGDVNKELQGKFTALVDGIMREDMSGTFKLTKIPE